MPAELDRLLLWFAAAHLVVGLVCLCGLAFDAPPLLGVHPASKPMKFGLSIALYLGTMAVIVPMLELPPAARQAIAWTLAVTMAIEMVLIAVQAARGTTSHFNVDGRLSSAMWSAMFAAIVVATIAMLAVALVATLRPLRGAAGTLAPWTAIAWRAGLWLFLLAAISGFAMGGRSRHTVGGDDGGAGLPVVNWSLRHGDLRVSHFIALHALQTIPGFAALLAALPIGAAARWAALLAAIALQGAAVVWTLVQALASRPVW
jgi:hypothetical protein